MAQYATLKAAIDAVIKANGQREITGTVLNQTLNAMVNSLGANYQFAGVATPSTNPGTPDQNVFYLAGQGGTYTNFNNIAIPNGISFLMWNGSWSSQTVLSGDGGVFDISAYKATGGTLATFADLSAALGENGANVPIKFGGMQVRFVSSSDNKYVQFRYMSSSTAVADFTNVANWQGVDDEPTAGSENLVKSGGVKSGINSAVDNLGDFVLQKNLFNKDSTTLGFIGNDGTITESNTYCYSDYIPVSGGFIYIVNSFISSPGGFYDENKNWISVIPNRSTIGANGIFSPNSDGYIRINLRLSSKDEFMVLNGKKFPTSYIPYNKATKEDAYFKISQILNADYPLSIDNLPTKNSQNLVKSSGVYSFAQEIANEVVNGSDERLFNIGNLFNKESVEDGLINNDGTITESNIYCYSDYIPVKKNVQYVCSSLFSTPGGFYDENKNFISPISRSGATFIQEQDGYVRVNIYKNSISTYIVTFGSTIPENILPYGKVTNEKASFKITQINEDGNATPLVGRYGNLFEAEKSALGLINNDGTITESNTYCYSDYIPVHANTTYIASRLFSSPGGFYDENKTWVSTIPLSSGAGENKTFTIVQDGYIRINIYVSAKNTFTVSIGTELINFPKGEKVICPNLVIERTQLDGSKWKGKKLVCIGDSITDVGAWVDMLGSMLGTITYNRGNSGSSFAKNPDRQDSFCHRADLPASDDAGHHLGFPTEADLVFVLGGVNDWGMDLPTGTENSAIDTNTTCGALHYLMRNLKDRYPNAKIVFGIPYRVWSPTGAFPAWSEITFNDANDETAGFEYKINTSGKTFNQIRQSIRDICSMYGIGVISLLDCGFSFWKTSDREAYSLLRDIGGTMKGDGLHPSDNGSVLIAQHLYNELNKLAM